MNQTELPILYQSAVIPYRFRSGELEILLITSLKKKNWIIPKGFVENEMTPQESAEKEAFEEAGVDGRINSDPLDVYFQEKWGGNCRIEVYSMPVESEYDTWPEKDLRDRKWFPVKKAVIQIRNDDLKEIIKRFQKLFQRMDN
jgi:ADP-ribose pyrophosphatase YjhB (NUDIX family)